MFPVLFPFFMRHGSVKAADNINTAGSRIELYDRATGGGESIMYTYIYIYTCLTPFTSHFSSSDTHSSSLFTLSLPFNHRAYGI